MAPFVVLDERGVGYDLPFLGGLDVPRPQFVDIDGDGDYDLFLQEYTDQLWHFENTGTPQVAKYEWRSNRFHDLSIGEWFRFHDIDADGDPDLLSEKPFSYISLYRNTGKGAFVDVTARAGLGKNDAVPRRPRWTRCRLDSVRCHAAAARRPGRGVARRRGPMRCAGGPARRR